MYFDHGLHTADYIVTPIVQSDDKPVGKTRRITPDATLKAIDKPKKAYAQCPIGWKIGSPEAMIGAIGYDWDVEARGHYSLTSVEIYTQHPDTDLSSWALRIGAYLVRQTTTQALQAATNAFGFYRAEVNPPLRMNSVNHGVMGFSVELVAPDSKVVDRAVSCYRMHSDRQAFQEAGRIERVIPIYTADAYGVDAGVSSLLSSDWNDYYRSEWRIDAVAGAPSLRRPKLTTMWAQLKKR